MNLKENEVYAMASEMDVNTLIQKATFLKRNKIIVKIEEIIKRTLDITCGIIGIIALIPLTAFIYIANLMIGDKGPIFYTQNRIGKDGKEFKMYKYRSMVLDADEKLSKYLEENEEAREEYKKYKKLKKDPRITKVGKFIRKASIDEFPQFINVLKGDMSLVGPRPYLPREKEEINGYLKYITSVRPGLTGPWQISGRSGVTFVDRLQMDMDYYYNHTLKTDMKIMRGTFLKVIKKEGAI